MTAIVLNTLTGAPSEYDWGFASISEDFAGDAGGLYTLGGDTDNGAPIAASLLAGKPGGEAIERLGNVFVAVKGTGDGELIVQGESGTTWYYPVAARPSGVGCAKPGLGIKETRLALGYRNVAGAAFRVDRIDAEMFVSKTRRS
jgi:hypothetical protein